MISVGIIIGLLISIVILLVEIRLSQTDKIAVDLIKKKVEKKQEGAIISTDTPEKLVDRVLNEKDD